VNTKYHNTFHEGDFYHIYNRGINNEILFKTKRNYLFFIERWIKYIGELLEVCSYCLLPTHFHFFVRVSDSFAKLQKFRKATDINKLLEHQFMLLFRSYALAFNKENSRTGSLFQKGFKRIRIDNEQYFVAIIHYIHNNPIHHHYVDDYKDWHFSSYKAFISDIPTKINRENILKWFGSKETFIQFHKENIKYEKIDKFLF
jgi:putative transposase